MTESDYREALRLLDAAVALLHRPRSAVAIDLARELRRLSLELELLRARVGQVPAATLRN